MRREGFEMQVSRPEVLLREVDGEVLEPYERVTIDIPPEFIGSGTESMAARKGRVEEMAHGGRAEGPDGADDHRCRRPRAARVRDARSWTGRLPRAAVDGDARHGIAAPD